MRVIMNILAKARGLGVIRGVRETPIFVPKNRKTA